MKYRFFIIFIASIFILSACKVDDEEKIAKLELEGKIPANLDRTDTLQGIDANNNGVRDDIERYIEQNFPLQIKEAMQMAKSVQLTLTVKNGTDSDYVTNKIIRAINCIDFSVEKSKSLNQDLKTTNQIVTQIRNLTTNTKQRLMAYLEYNDTRDGTVIGLPDGNTCDE